MPRLQSLWKKIKEKNPGENKKAVASQIAIGAVIFWDLSHDRIRDIEFSWNNVLDFEGENRSISSILMQGQNQY